MKAERTILSACQEAKEFLFSIPTSCTVGVGRTSPWAIEGNPPEVDPHTFTQEELVAYFPIRKAYLVHQHPQGNIKIDDKNYFRQENLDVYNLAYANALEILIEVDIFHNELSVDSYNSLGLYSHVIYKPDMPEINSKTKSIPKHFVINSLLDTLIHYPKIQVQQNFIHRVQILRSFL